MLILKQSQNNLIAVNAIQEAGISDLYGYVFRFVHQLSKEEKIFFAKSVVTSNERYIEFSIDEVSYTIIPENLLEGDVVLQNGDYDYEIYFNNSELLDLNIDGLERIEEGLMKVYPADDDIKFKYFEEYQSDNEDNSNYIFI